MINTLALIRWSILLSLSTVLADTPKPTHLDKLLERIPTDKPFTVEQFLNLDDLPDGLKRNYVLMTESGSRHMASKDTPRVVAFTTKPDDDEQLTDQEPMVMAFSGDATDPNYNAVEFMQFRKAPPRWELKVVNFSPKDSKTPPKVSASNPQTCVSCHKNGVPENGLVPRFQVYPHWKGVVGENSATLSPAEKDYLTKFETDGAKNPRYKLLDRKGNLADATKTAVPWRIDRMFTATGVQIMADRLQKTSFYDKLKYAYLGAAYGCPKLWEMVPSESKLGGEKEFNEQMKTVSDAVKAGKNKQTERALEYSKLGIRVTAGLRFLMEPLKVSFTEQGRVPSQSGFPIVKSGGEAGVSTALVANTEIAAHQFAQAMCYADKDLLPLRVPSNVLQYLAFGSMEGFEYFRDYKPAAERICDKIKKKSLEALKDFTVPTPTATTPAVAKGTGPSRHTVASQADTGSGAK